MDKNNKENSKDIKYESFEYIHDTLLGQTRILTSDFER